MCSRAERTRATVDVTPPKSNFTAAGFVVVDQPAPNRALRKALNNGIPILHDRPQRRARRYRNRRSAQSAILKKSAADRPRLIAAADSGTVLVR